MSGRQPAAGDAISIDDVEAAVIAVRQIQGQVADILDAMTRLAKRIETLEAAQAARG